jgi:hypothetical protein
MVPPPDVGRQTLLRLLARGAEGVDLDYKEQFHPGANADVVKLTKDIGAMMALGGHIVIGADSGGQVQGGLSQEDAVQLDESTLRDKIKRFIPEGFHLYTAVHEHQGVRIGVIHIPPHPDGFCCFTQKGQYKQDDGTTATAFQDAVYVRHGSSSEPATQQDLLSLIRAKEAAGPALDDRPGWQFLLFIDELDDGLAAHEAEWRDYRLGVARHHSNELITLDGFGEDVAERCYQARRLVEAFGRILTPEHSSEIFRTAADSRDPEPVKYLAASIIDTNVSMMAWAAEIRGLRVEDELQPTYEILATFVDLPLNQMRQWIAATGLQIREAVDWLRSDSTEDESRTVETTLTLEIAPAVMEQLDEELQRLDRILRRRH